MHAFFAVRLIVAIGAAGAFAYWASQTLVPLGRVIGALTGIGSH